MVTDRRGRFRPDQAVWRCRGRAG